MTVFPFQINEVMHLYNRLSKLKPSTILEKDQEEPQDVVQISAEAKKRQVIDQARSEVMEHIRKTR
jgi:uncharacterized protein YabN with tetrapyrrole methylase and pyrophosphatase domain